MKEQTASRWGAVATVVAIALLIAILPRRYHLLPTWYAYLTVAVMILPMLVVSVTRGQGVWLQVERVAEFFAVGFALAVNILNLTIAAYNLVENPGNLEPVSLFYTSIGIWTGNVLIFALIYWLVDSGGPEARLAHKLPYPDFDFPAMDDDVHVPPGWRPGMVDYLFLAFTTSTAFSPTEAMPLTSRAKLLVVFQSTISLVTIAIVAARTINILK
ncbi:MAG TPA: hypothetical protein VGI19_02255 [Candidatus Cybelea sp.]